MQRPPDDVAAFQRFVTIASLSRTSVSGTNPAQSGDGTPDLVNVESLNEHSAVDLMSSFYSLM